MTSKLRMLVPKTHPWSVTWHWRVAAFAGCLVIFAVYWLAYFPAQMSGDSVDQWAQASSLSINDWHPAAHTLLIFLLRQIVDAPWFVALLQAVTLAALLSFCVSLHMRSTLHPALLVASVVLIALNPCVAFLSNTLWKDVPYAAGCLGLTLAVRMLWRLGATSLRMPRRFAALVGAALAVLLFRHNGPAVVIVTFLALLVAHKERKLIYAAGVTIVVIALVIKGPVYSAVGVTPAPPRLAMMSLIHQIAAVVADSDSFARDHESELTRYLSLDEWRAAYNPYSLDPLQFHEKNPWVDLARDKHLIFRVWGEALIQHPTVIVTHVVRVTSLIWRVTLPAGTSITGAARTIYTPNSIGYSIHPVWPAARTMLDSFYEWSTRGFWYTLFWRPALWLLFDVVLLAAGARRHGRQFLALGAPLMGHVAGLALTIPAQDVRYMMPATVCLPAIFIAALSVAGDRLQDERLHQK